MKLICKTQSDGCVVEFTDNETRALNRLQDALRGKTIQQSGQDHFNSERVRTLEGASMEVIFDAIAIWTYHKFLINDMRQELDKLESLMNPTIVEESQK